jgi:hypothetical protein
MPIMQTCFGLVLSLIAPAAFFTQPIASAVVLAQSAAPAVVLAQSAPTPLVDPPRQEMQTVAPNLPVGPYLINVTGKTFVSDVFLDVAVTDNGRPAPDGTTVTFDAVPMTTGDSTPTGASPVHLSAVTAAGHAKFVPAIAAAGDWNFTLGVAGTAGDGIAPPQKVGIDPHRPQVSLTYRLSQIAIPIVTVLVLLAFFRVRHIDLERWPIGRMPARLDPGQGHERQSLAG